MDEVERADSAVGAEATAPVPQQWGWTETALSVMVLVWGVNFAVVKRALVAFDPLAFNALRFVIASVFVYAVLRARGLKLNYPEARALIADEICEGARDGKSVAELMGFGQTLLTTDDVQPGVAKLVGTLQVEAMFPAHEVEKFTEHYWGLIGFWRRTEEDRLRSGAALPEGL